MIEHIVLIKLKQDSLHKLDEICAALNSLKEKIPEIVAISAGRNFSDRHQGFQMGLRSQFKSEADLKIYTEHPEHQDVLNRLIAPHKEDVIALDYQI